MSTVENILRLGDDALANQWICVFPAGIPGGGNADTIALRMDQQFDPPQQITYVYDIDFRGDKIRKTGKKNDTTKEFTISVRVDQQWGVYDDLRKWQLIVYDPLNNNASPDSLSRASVVIQNIDGTNTIKKSFKFTYVKLTGMKVTTFDQTSGDPLRVECTFIYGDFDDGVTV